MYEKATAYIEKIENLSEDEIIPIVHHFQERPSKQIMGRNQGTMYEYNPMLWECLNKWSEDHFVKTVWDETKTMRKEDFSSDEWLDNLTEHQANLTLSWLVSNEDYHRGTLADWVKNGTLVRVLKRLEEADA
ncbi:MAG: DUF6508 domain-containing protein [Lawsonella sp.]|nr:hypothetical protein [Mycobacteriales bacterium]